MSSPYSAAKDRANVRKHGISLARYVDFDIKTAIVFDDDSQDYGEPRSFAIGFLDARLHVLVFSEPDEIVRPISLRKATKEEASFYANY